MSIKELRLSKNLTQKEVSQMCGISLRSYKSYENDLSKIGSIKYNYIMHIIEEYGKIDESHGIIKVEDIKNKCSEIFKEYEINYCYLFGSYSRNDAKNESDVDLLISGNVDGLKFYGLVERLRESLHKKVDLLSIEQLNNNPDLLNEILRDGFKIYG